MTNETCIGSMGMPDCTEVQALIAAAETRGWNAAIEAACKAARDWAAETFDGDPVPPDEYIRALKKGE